MKWAGSNLDISSGAWRSRTSAAALAKSAPYHAKTTVPSTYSARLHAVSSTCLPNPTKRAIEACECVQVGTARAACKAFHHFEDMRPLIIVRTVMMRSPPREHICLNSLLQHLRLPTSALQGGWQECARGFAGVAGPASHARARERGVNGSHTTRSSRSALALSARHQANAHWLWQRA